MATLYRTVQPMSRILRRIAPIAPIASIAPIATPSSPSPMSTLTPRSRDPRASAGVTTAVSRPLALRGFHAFRAARKRRSSATRVKAPETRPPTDFGQLDVLGNTPVPATSVDMCAAEGFWLNNGARVLGGSGVLLVGGEAFAWRPWGGDDDDKRLVNAAGQWEVPDEAFGLLSVVWPRPDLLIIGLGPDIRPLSPRTRDHISTLGMRVEIVDTRNAAAQFNLLATERGVDDVAAAMIPIGWKEGVGAVE